MKTLKIFLASSEELRPDRDEFELFIGRENDGYHTKNLFLDLIRWEKFDDSMDKARLQNKYNNAVKEADIFIILYSLKVGKYTEEEFDTAYTNFKETDLPLIFTYRKETLVNNNQWNENDYISLKNFQKKLLALGHFETSYSSLGDLKSQFKYQLEKLLAGKLIHKMNGGRGEKMKKIKLDVQTEPSKSVIKNHNLPARTYGTKLIGRKAYIKKILKAIQESPIVTIEGFSGVGKTSVALEIAYIFLNKSELKFAFNMQFDFLVWIVAKNKDQKQWLNEVLNKIAEVLGYPSITQIPPDNLTLKKREVDLLLHDPGKRLFLVIDNFETIDDNELVEWLFNLKEQNKVLITSQKQEFESRNINLKRLLDDEAIALIRRYTKTNELNHLLSVSDEKLLNLVQITSGNPLAIRLSIGQISGGMLSLDQVVDNLKENNPTESIDTVFEKIHETSWVSIGTKAQQLLLVTPLFIGTDSIEKKALQETSGLSKKDYEDATHILLAWKLLEPNFNNINRLVIHPMTRRFVTNKLLQNAEFESIARGQWYKYYFEFIGNYVKRSHPSVEYWNALVSDKMDKIDVEWPTIYEVLKWSASEKNAENDQLLLNLTFLLIHYMDSRFYNLERIKYVELAIAAANRLESKYYEALLRIDALGWTYVEENKYNEADYEIIKGIELAKQVKPPFIETNELMALGYAWAARVKIEQDRSELVDEAVKLIDQALTFTDDSQPWIRFRILMAAGDISLKQNKNKEALEKYKAAKTEMVRYGGEGNYYQINPRIGLANLALGDLLEAETIFTDLSNQKKISIGKLYGDYGLALIKFKNGDIKESNHLLENVKEELSKRTSSNLLLKLIKEFEKTLKE